MPADPSVKISKGKGVKKAPGQKRTRTGCASCRQKRYKCDENKPKCSRCSKSGTDCLYPIDLPKEKLFQPYEQSVASTSSLSQPPNPTNVDSSSALSPFNAVASSSRQTLPFQPFQSPSSSSPDAVLNTFLYKSPTSALELSYPNPEERNLMYHFLSALSTACLAPATSPGVTTSCFQPQSITQLIPQFDICEFLSHRSNSVSHEALSLALMSTGSSYISFLQHGAAMNSLFDSDPSLADSSLVSYRKYKDLSESLADSSLALARSSKMILSMGVGRDESEVDDELAVLNLTANSIVWTRCMNGGGNFREALDLAKDLVGQRGGPMKILMEAKQSRDPTKLRKTRSMLEELVMWEVFSCLSNGKAPDLSMDGPSSALLDPSTSSSSDSSSFARWYFEFSPASGSPRSIGSNDWETCESALGISRGLLEILHRVNILYACSRPSNFDPLNPTADYPLVIDASYLNEATALLAEVSIWKDAFSITRPVQERNRLDSGNLIMANALEIILHLDLLFYPPSHPEIHTRAKEIGRLVTAEFLRNGFVFGFMWPMIISASTCSGERDRMDARSALQTLRSVCCFDLHSAWSVLDKTWERRDAGDMWASWRTVSGEGGGLALI
ncbi:fungal-specific transcription factor domain-containing protein [Mrakia frigida]|uniref:Zn(II)2Cys6 transcription factor n=1 Tax=Mrakia frigida TaxID=29902 RepID=UPI003FCC132E